MILEQWRNIAGFEGRYEVSDEGRVRSVGRAVPSPRHGESAKRIVQSKILSANLRAGYPTINLLMTSGERVSKQVHRLVAAAFIPNPLAYPEINHIDADRTNCRAANLEWCSRSQNVAHAYRIGSRPTGPRHHFANLERDAGGRCKPKKYGGGWEVEKF